MKYINHLVYIHVYMLSLKKRDQMKDDNIQQEIKKLTHV